MMRGTISGSAVCKSRLVVRSCRQPDWYRESEWYALLLEMIKSGDC